MRPKRKAAPALAVAALIMLASGAAGAQTTADQVVDDETLKAFVEGAAAEIAAITDIRIGGQLRDRFRTDPAWHSGSMFLILFTQSGNPFIHGNDRAAENRDLLDVVDDNGFRVVEALLAAGARGGDFVRYHDGEPKTAYAIEYTSGISGRRFVLVGGYSQDTSHAPLRIADLPRPAVTASQVVDRETLVAFVEAAAKVYSERALNTAGYRDFAAVRNAFRQEGGHWKSGSVYLWIVAAGNITFFHATEPFREGRATDLTRTDVNGVMFAEELIGGARREGSRFLQYNYDDPTIEGDEDTGSPKLGYAVRIPVFDTGQFAVIGSGVYLGADSATLDTDAVPKAWLARFGRTVGSQVTDAVAERLGAGLSPGAHATFAGQPLDLSRTDDGKARADAMTGLARAFAAPDAPNSSGDPFVRHDPSGAWNGPAGASAPARSMTGHELLLGSAFHLAGKGEGSAPRFAAWGRVTQGSFDGEQADATGRTRLDGEVLTGVLGADADWGGVLAGVAVSVSDGEGGFDNPGADRGKSGDIESSLTTVTPYARFRLTERVSAWGLAGWGTGDMTIRFDDGSMAPTRTDIGMRMGALGARGALLEQDEAHGMDLALRADAFFVRMDSEKTSNSPETEADASRVRLVLEGGRSVALSETVTFRPSLELGVRHDGGDAETGTGVELGGGVAYTDTVSGLSIEARARMLVAHADSDYEEWGVSATARLDPGEHERGLSFSLSPVIGATSSATERLWGAPRPRGLAPGGAFEASRGLRAEAGYGLALFGGRFTGTPNAGFGLSDGGARDYRVGWRLAPAVRGDPGFEVNLDATRREADDDNEHAVMLRGAITW